MKKTGLRFLKYALAGILFLPSLTSLAYAAPDDDSDPGSNPVEAPAGEGGAGEGGTGGNTAAGTNEAGETIDASLKALVANNLTNEDAEINSKIVVDVYKVAEAVKDPKFETYTYTLLSGYTLSGYDISQRASTTAGTKALADLTKEDWDKIGQQFAAQILETSSTMEPAATGDMNTEIKKDITRGLYLIVPRNDGVTDKAEYVVKKTDKDTSVTTYQTKGDTTRYRYLFMPQLVSIPSTQGGIINSETTTDDGETGIKTSDGDWSDKVSIELKATREPLYGQLKIVKEIAEFELNSPVTFVFTVDEIDKDGNIVTTKGSYHNVASITFDKSTGTDIDAAAKRQTVLTHIPVGTILKVTEIYGGAEYTVVGSDTDTTTILEAAPAMVKVDFKNDYNFNKTKGYGIRNEFAKNNEDWTTGHLTYDEKTDTYVVDRNPATTGLTNPETGPVEDVDGYGDPDFDGTPVEIIEEEK